jgi:hypothetical protein
MDIGEVEKNGFETRRNEDHEENEERRMMGMKNGSAG